MRRGQRSAGVSPAQNRWSHIVLSRVGKGGAPAIQGLAGGGRDDTGRKGTDGPMDRRAAILQENGPLKFFGRSRFAV